MAALTLTFVSVAGAAQPLPPASTPIRVKWHLAKPDRMVLYTEDGDVELREAGGYFSGTTPASTAPIAQWPLVARYGRDEVSLVLKVRHGRPGLSFELPKPSPAFCHDHLVTRTEQPTYNVGAALRSMLEAHYLLQISTPNDCSPEFRGRLVESRLQRNYDAVRLSGYLGVVPEFREEFARLSAGNTRMASALAQIDREALGVAAKQLYEVQLAAQARGDWDAALAMNQELGRLATTSEGWRSALAVQRLDSDRLSADAAFLAARTDQQSSAVDADPHQD